MAFVNVIYIYSKEETKRKFNFSNFEKLGV